MNSYTATDSMVKAIEALYSGLWANCGADVDSINWKDEHTTTEAERTAIQAKFDEFDVERSVINLRHVRNGLLAETDWWASSDLTMTAEQTAYRQALRDITNTYSSLDDVVWPTKP